MQPPLFGYECTPGWKCHYYLSTPALQALEWNVVFVEVMHILPYIKDFSFLYWNPIFLPQLQLNTRTTIRGTLQQTVMAVLVLWEESWKGQIRFLSSELQNREALVLNRKRHHNQCVKCFNFRASLVFLNKYCSQFLGFQIFCRETAAPKQAWMRQVCNRLVWHQNDLSIMTKHDGAQRL